MTGHHRHRAVLVLITSLVWCATVVAELPSQGTLRRVRDGDTLEIEAAGETYAVRLIGVSAAELHSIVPCAKHWAEEATRYLTMLVTGQPLRLAYDVETTDKYDRVLAYVFVGDLMVNALLIQYGLAAEVDSGKNRQHRALLQAMEREAKIYRRGMWGS